MISVPSEFFSQSSNTSSLRGCVRHTHESLEPVESQGSAGFNAEGAEDPLLIRSGDELSDLFRSSAGGEGAKFSLATDHRADGAAVSAGRHEAFREIALPVGLAVVLTLAAVLVGGWLAWS